MRIADARTKKSLVAQDMQEAYFFSAPDRCRQIYSNSPASKVPPRDAAELQITIAIEEAENFATTLIQSFMPPGVPWIDLKASTSIPAVMHDQFTEQAKADQKIIFDLINESELYAELPAAMIPDAAVGTFALMIETGGKLYGRVPVMAIPLRELEINIGPDGRVDDRFVTRHTKARSIRKLVGKDTPLSSKVEEKIRTQRDAPAKIVWGFWRLWDRDVCTWQKVVLVDEEIVYSGELVGEGACPLVVVPFNRRPEQPYGTGPLIKAAPDLRVLDDMAAGEVDNIDLSLRPPLTYPDDSFANVEEGVESGGLYPIRPGTEGAVKKMYEPNSLEAVYFEQAKREQRVRRLFYNDFPQQRGDTPPTATQWVDEMAMAQRKIGTPGLRFWEDGPAQIFMRFKFIAEERGLTKNRIKIKDREFALIPDNPTKRAQDQQKVAMAVRGAQIGLQMFPEEFKAKVDGAKTLTNLFELLGVEDVIVPRAPGDLQAAIGMISKLAGAAPSNTDIQPGAIGGAPLPPQGGQ